MPIYPPMFSRLKQPSHCHLLSFIQRTSIFRVRHKMQNDESEQFNSKSILPAGVADSKEAGNQSNTDDGCSSKFFHIFATFSQYQGFWYEPTILERVKDLQEHFKAHPGDILLCSAPKAGTNWLKSLAFAIATRNQYSSSNSNNNPLFTTTPQELVPFIEQGTMAEFPSFGDQRRLLSTHVPYSSLTGSLSSCKMIYICRDPKDVLVSLWYFVCKLFEPIPFEKMFEIFCEGKSIYGPYWDHIITFWKASLKHPDKVMFLKYEDLKSDASSYVKKIAEFMGCPFSFEEEKDGEVKKITTLCSFKNLSTIEVNKSGKRNGLSFIPNNNVMFRKGIVGDWKNHLSPDMRDILDNLTQQKFEGYNLSFTCAPEEL